MPRIPRDAIELGRAQFGVASADQVIRAASKGAPIVVLAQLFQTNPLHWIYRTDKSPFKNPADFKGRVVGITFGGNDETIMRALLAKYNIADSELTLYSVRYDYTPFYQGKVDFWPLYINAQAPIIGAKLKKAGESYSFVGPADFGIQFVANSVVTSDSSSVTQTDPLNCAGSIDSGSTGAPAGTGGPGRGSRGHPGAPPREGSRRGHPRSRRGRGARHPPGSCVPIGR